eukprot:6184741-Alexandrium_andersonii.AAC.1
MGSPSDAVARNQKNNERVRSPPCRGAPRTSNETNKIRAIILSSISLISNGMQEKPAARNPDVTEQQPAKSSALSIA